MTTSLRKKIQDKNTHSATQLIKSTVGDGATGLQQSYVSAQHCERPRACNYVNTHTHTQQYPHIIQVLPLHLQLNYYIKKIYSGKKVKDTIRPTVKTKTLYNCTVMYNTTVKPNKP